MIQTFLLWLMAVVTLALAVYAHFRIPYHTPNSTQATIARLLLVLVGLAFGWVMAGVYAAETGLHWWLIFLASFGLVHLPAAVILFLKGQREAHG